MIRASFLSLPLTVLWIGAAFSQDRPADALQQGSEPPSTHAVRVLYEQAFIAQVNAAALEAEQQESRRRMDVDIEVFRRLLDEKAQQLQADRGAASISSYYWPHRAYGIETTAFSPAGKLLYAQSGDATKAIDARSGGAYWYGVAQSTAAPARAFEGVYLADYGILFTATLPAGRVVFDPHSGVDVYDHKQCASCHVDAAAVVPSPQPRPSRWEQLHRELSGESAAEKHAKEFLSRATKTQPASPPSREEEARTLAAALAKVLAENGKHLSELGDDERVVLAITLQSRPSSNIYKRSSLKYQDFYGYSASQSDPADSPMPAAAASEVDSEDAVDPNDPVDPEAEGSAASAVAPADGTPTDVPATVIQALGRIYQSSEDVASRSPSTLREYVLLGDLHVKQGKTQAALDAYRDAAAVLGEVAQFTIDKDASADDARAQLEQAQQQIIQLYAKLAHVQALLGRHEEARATMQKVAEGMARLKVRIGDAVVDVTVNDTSDKVLGEAKKSAARLPVKLIVSAPKKLLLEVGEGAISLEEFKKQLSIEVRGLEQAESSGVEANPSGGR